MKIQKTVVVNKKGGVGFFGCLAILFIGLKLAGFIDWSWWAVTAPLWGGVAAVLGLIVMVVIGIIAVALYKTRKKTKSKKAK